jgi:TusA-related sulfurtransferase
MNTEYERAPAAWPMPDALLDWTQETPESGSACALLTPAIKARLRELAPGQTLEVRVADPTAREDIQAWTRLAGHELLGLMEEPPGQLRALLRKKQG